MSTDTTPQTSNPAPATPFEWTGGEERVLALTKRCCDLIFRSESCRYSDSDRGLCVIE